MPDPTPICAFDVWPDGRALPAADLGPSAADGAAYRWLHFDLKDPNLKGWVETHLARIPGAALMQTETRPRCDSYEDGIILNLRGVNANPGQSADDMVSLRLWIAGGLIVSARVRKVFALDDIRQTAEDGRAPDSVGAFLGRLAEGLTYRIEDTTLKLSDRTDDLEDNDDDDHAARTELRHSTIKFRRYIGPQRDALFNLAGLDTPLLSRNARHRLRESANRTTRSVEELDATRDRLTVLQDHWAAERATRNMQNGHLLSIVATIFLPLGLLTGLFGVNVGGMPGIEWPWAFAALTGVTVALGIVAYLVLKLLKWF